MNSKLKGHIAGIISISLLLPLTLVGQNADSVVVYALKAPINSKASDMSPVYSEARGELLFASNGVNPAGELKVYRSVKKGLEWGKPEAISILGTFKKENASFEVVNEDGKLFFYKDVKGGDIFYSQPGKNGWLAPVEFDSKVSSTHLASHFFINEHEDRIIFATELNKKKGGLDLYESFKNSKTGKWTKPTAFASVIDSEYDEDSPYLSADEQKLYFSSNRPNGLGGFDVYMSTFDSANLNWTEPVNLGAPVNSPGDDVQYKQNKDGESGYFVSNREGALGDFDIYYFWKMEKAFVEGRVVNALSNKPLADGEIRFYPSRFPEQNFSVTLNTYGKYRLEVNSDDIFRVEIVSGGQTIGAEQFEIHDAEGERITHFKDFYFIPTNATEEEVAAYQNAKKPTEPKDNQQVVNQLIERAKNATKEPEKKTEPTARSTTNTNKKPETKAEPKQPVKEPEVKTSQLAQLSGYKTGSKAILHNVYFNPGTSMLTEQSNEVLTELLKFLRSNQTTRVEISGHSDNQGSADVNQWLSQRRAESVAKWLIKNGVAPERLATKGYGESAPLASNDDEEGGRELNRRIEVLVIQ